MSWRRGRAYGQDLRDRLLAALVEPIRAVAARVGVSPSYVPKVRTRLRKIGETTPVPPRNHVVPRLGPLCDVLQARAAAHADAKIAESRVWAASERGIAVSHPAMWKTLAQSSA